MASLVGAFAISQTGCEWALDIHTQPSVLANDGGTDTGIEGDAGVGERDADVADADGAIDRGDGGTDERDADVADLDAANADADVDGSMTGNLDADIAADTSVPVDAAPEPCTADTTWYRDDDGDGFGIANDARKECPKPAGSWSTRPGDCQDANPSVNPGQSRYFDVPFQGVDGLASYDYDCNGVEEGSKNQPEGVPGCASLLGLLCGDRGGFVKTSRAGATLNSYCGSRSYQRCSESAILGCSETGTDNVSPGYVCR